MKRQLLPGAIAGILIASGVAVIPAAQATEQLKLAVDANITDGTCSVAVLEGESPTNTIAFSNVYISEVFAKTQVKPFKLRFSNCAGLVDKKATVSLAPAPGIRCAGGTTTNAEFSNASSSTTKATKSAVEVWTTETPEGAGSTQFHCYVTNPQTVDLSSASANTPVDYPLSARMVPVTGSSINELTAGDFYSPTVFTVTYQ
ncbi:fimbrial protein [Salmonella enterica subsp. salamae]|nr:fimbrial protein [Salmonella enterica]EBP4573608.1 fimbrial protein [Salmonella enterica]ECJ5916481.1 fimbrial protein [Salmonella enterica subsp. salamae]ECW0040538.1 fimbrial protein [Salmonella enterica]HCL5270679.1 fimbrial protein [Salmonella enterica]